MLREDMGYSTRPQMTISCSLSKNWLNAIKSSIKNLGSSQNKHFFLKKPEKCLNFAKNKILTVLILYELRNISMVYWTSSDLSAIAIRPGKPLYLNVVITVLATLLEFIRVCIEMM